MTNKITIYKIYNFRGYRVIYSLYPLQDEIIDEIEVELPKGFSLEFNRYGQPMIYYFNSIPVELITTKRGLPALLVSTEGSVINIKVNEK